MLYPFRLFKIYILSIIDLLFRKRHPMSIINVSKLFICIAISCSFTFAKTDDSIAAGPAPAATSTTKATMLKPVAASNKLSLFSPAQYDSVLAILPGGDSLRTQKNIVSVGVDPATGEIVVISLDTSGMPEKATFPAASIKRKPASASTATPPAKKKLDQNGRTWFIIESTVKSAGIYPISFSNAFSGGNPQTIAGFSLLTIGGTLYGTYAFTKNMELGYGKVGLMNYGSTLFGSYYPALIAAFLDATTDLGKQPVKTTTDEWGDTYSVNDGIPPAQQIDAWLSMVGFPLGMVIGSKINLVDKDDFGKVAVMEYMSQTWGGIGFVLPLFFIDPSQYGNAYLTASSLLSMALLPTGIAAGKAMCGDRYISAGRGTLPWVSGLLGTATGLAIPALFDFNNIDYIAIARIYSIFGIAGYGAGTWLGMNYHPGTDYSYLQTVFIGASTCAGVVMGVALPLVAQAADQQPYIIAGALGGWAGFFLGEKLSLSLFEKSSQDRHASSIKFELPCLAALPVIWAADKNALSKGYATGRLPALPMADFEWRF